MTYELFIKGYNGANNKDEYMKKHILNKYVPYLEKVGACNMIVDTCLYKTIDVEGMTNKRVFSKNTPLRFVMFIVTIVNKYTDIEFDEGMNVAQIYDVLNQDKVLDKIMEFIPKDEYVEFNTILEMIEDDEITNSQSIVNWLNEQINVTDIIKDTFNDAVEEMQNKVTE